MQFIGRRLLGKYVVLDDEIEEFSDLQQICGGQT